MNRNQQRQGSEQGHHGRDPSQWRGTAQQGGQGQKRQLSQQGGTRQGGGRQSMQQGGDTPQFGGRQFESMAEVALRGTAPLPAELQLRLALAVGGGVRVSAPIVVGTSDGCSVFIEGTYFAVDDTVR